MKTKKLLKMMIDKNMTKKQLAEKTDISFRQISKITTGESSGSLGWWRKAAEVLGVDISDIIE